MLGANVGRPGILTQCAVEEATELDLGMRGYTAYAETVSVYGTEDVFMDGDDTPWSKAFLASCYASRGVKMRFTSGTGSEVQMGMAEGKSMLYLEARCLGVTRGAGVQGTQNGSVSCIGVPAAVPGGIRAVACENLIAAMLDLENASSNDQSFTHSDLRRVARSIPQFIPGTDYICSGYSSTPNYDNMFAGSNWDADDYDDWCVIQRDLRVDAGLLPAREEEVVAARNKAAKAIQALFRELGLPEITDEEVINKIGLPCFIKPNAGGSSFGVTKVKTKEDIQPAIEKAFEESDEVMIEAFMKGTEITCGCYKTSDKEVVFPITEVVSANEFFDYGAKYNGESQEITPARLPEDTAERVRLLTSAIYDILGCSGLIRIDYIITEGEKVNLLEINTTPGMTATSFIPQQVRAAGLDIKDVMTDIIENKF